MISEALELHVEGGRVRLSYCMCVVMAMVGAGMEVVDGMHAGQNRGVGRMSGDDGVRRDTLMTPDHITVLVHSSG